MGGAQDGRLRRQDQLMLDEYVDHVQKAGGDVAKSYLREGEAANEIVELAKELVFYPADSRTRPMVSGVGQLH
jgi:hypothetical protein